MTQSILDDLVVDLNEEIEADTTGIDYSSLVVGSRDWTVDTIADQIKKGNFDLNPAFQRRNAWNDEKRSRFIESLILGVPIPQVVLAEDHKERGKFIVIDGKQRLLTVAGMYLPPFNLWQRPQFSKLNELKTLNGTSIDDFRTSQEFESQRRLLANAPIRCSILSGYNDVSLLYDIFYRLNSGSVPLSGQELRQVFYRGPFAQWLFEITNSLQPIHLVLGIQEPDRRLADIEIILRYIAVASSILPYNGNLRTYLDTTMDHITREWLTRQAEVTALYAEFNASLGRLGRVFGSPSRIGRRATNGEIETRFNKAIFEVQAYFFRFVPDSGLDGCAARFEQGFVRLCERPDFRQSIEATTKSIERFRQRFLDFRGLVNEAFELNITKFPEIAE